LLESSDDAQLVASIVGGDRSKFQQLYRRHLQAVHRRLTRMVGPVLERDDLTQQVFLLLHQALPRFRAEARFTTFLHRIVINVACDHLERRYRDRKRTVPLSDDQLDALVAPEASPETRALQRQQLRRVFQHLAVLRPRKRIAFVLVAVEGLALEEAAELVGASPDAVKQRVLQARRELSARMARGEGR
jgi:RNA polymerase sigma-70 factor (ECF subfamily)